jgi:ATP-binding cassette, subfamily G (WHITE), eye pigment precursor transporter
MGPSGCGKTSLLNCLSGRATPSSGHILLNGQAATASALKRATAFIEQEDMFIPLLTTREHLTFIAQLCMDQQVPLTAKLARVEELLQQLGLQDCANTLIGGAGVFKGISGGERKRLSFASEIISSPQLIICDEPTSGLDSHMAELLVSMLRKLANEGCCVIASIHAPSSAVFEYFIHIHLLSSGHTAYFGTTAAARQHFATLQRPVPLHHNAADQ